ncbi:OLC1v1024530C1 [Oldenlandia corymbosa var. corymbosa]|uniref:OLC1v1024530C1 n=1 Tax=Oldenlandia corymbosa var. corymbosa TaxID=529605 RepID=A0AAV1C2Y7_OLDCO|nr:OLC1v1024530C1 [Oldenlandia corymbosa var. corymbosa]
MLKQCWGDSTVQRLRGIDVYRIGPGDADPLIGQCSNIIEEQGDCADDSGHDEYDIGDLNYGDDDSEYSSDSDGASASESDSDSALEPRADCSGNLDMDERKDQNEESLKVITAPDEPAVEILNLVPDDFEQTCSFWDQCSESGLICEHCHGEFKHGEWEECTLLSMKCSFCDCSEHLVHECVEAQKAMENNRQPEDAGNSVIAPVVKSQPREDPNKASPAMEMGCDDTEWSTFWDASPTILSHIWPETPILIRSLSSSEDDNDFSESELDERTDTLYNSFRNRGQEVRVRGNKFTCRFCKDDCAEIPVLAVPHAEVLVDPLQSHNPQDRFVYPPMAVVVNLPRKLDCGKFVGPSGRVLREKYLFEGFNPTKVEPLWDDETGHSGIGIVHFRRGFDGLMDALAFHQAYKNDHHGKQDWEGSGTHNDFLYAWVAQEDDYASTGIVGRILHRCAAIKRFDEIQGL